MQSGYTLGVLSTSFGGFYFGALLEGMSQVTAANGGRIIALQTTDAGTVSTDLAVPPPFLHRVAWDHISAFAVILNAVDAEYLTAARDAGKPIVMISDTVPGFSCPTVLPDNASGIREAVEHLIAHGHRQIAYLGNPTQKDIRERYEAYQETLRNNGINPDPRLFYDTGNNQESGGERAAFAMIEAGLPSTAVVTGNDLNAIGLMRTLIAAGYQLPRDQAIVGFDDMDSAVFQIPALSSIHQPFAAVGRLAVDLLLRQLDGEALAPEFHHVPTAFVARESCGCSSTLRLGGMPVQEIRTSAELTSSIAKALAPAHIRRAADTARLSCGVDRIVASLHAAATGEPGPDFAAVQEAMIDLHRIHPFPESLVSMMRCVRQFGGHVATTVPADSEARRKVEQCVQELILALAQAQIRLQFLDNTMFEARFWRQNEVSMGLLRSHEDDPRTLAWLQQRAHTRGGCLGLWSEVRPAAGHRPELDLFGMFPHHGNTQPGTDHCAVERFPPDELVKLLDDHPEDMLFVAPMKVHASNWGMLALVGPIEGRLHTSREDLNQWTALTTIALDHRTAMETLRAQQELLRHAALYDQLTGLPNRAHFLDRLQQSMARAGCQPGYAFGMLMLDLDGFKLVNDSLGHLAGDKLLIQVASRITTDLRSVDVAARFGGDEFAVLLDGIDSLDVPRVIAERLHDVLATPFNLDGQQVVVGASIGIALDTGDYHNPEDIIRDADIAMYSAKSREKGTHAVFDAAMHARAVDRLRTEADLRQALDRGELEVHYQPIMDLRTGMPASFEALIRWRHGERGLMRPAEFLHIAEESGLIIPIGRWMFGVACRQLREWQIRHNTPGLGMSINVSNRQFWRGMLIDDLSTCLRDSGLDPRRVAIEVTEGVIMHDVKLAGAILKELHDLGVELHIDDFGTGYSSLEALHHLRIDALKIDRSFVAPLGVDRKSDELARTIVVMGANLGLVLIAEGIETAAQLDHIRQLGCEYGQGYWFSEPLPADDADLFLEAYAPGTEARRRAMQTTRISEVSRTLP